MGLTSIIVGNTYPVLETVPGHRGVVALRLLRDHGVTHAVWRTWHKLENVDFNVDTLCGRRSNVPWKDTSKFRNKIDCMGCLVALGRL